MTTKEPTDPLEALRGALEHLTPTVTMSRDGLVLTGLKQAQATPPTEYLLADEAATRGLLEIRELPSPTVPTVGAVTGASEVLLLAGDSILGGKQNRVINISVWLAAMTTTRLPVTCLEHGRWNAGDRFGVGRSVDYGLRHTLNRSVTERVHRAPAETGPMRFSADQPGVWNEISQRQTRSGVHSGTGAVHDIYERDAASGAEMTAAFPCPSGATGVAIAIGGRLVALELFADASTLERRWSRVVEAAVSSHLDHQRAVRAGLSPAARHRYPDEGALGRMVKRAAGALDGASAVPSIGRGTAVRFAAEKVHGAALIVDHRLVHLELLRPAGQDVPLA